MTDQNPAPLNGPVLSLTPEAAYGEGVPSQESGHGTKKADRAKSFAPESLSIDQSLGESSALRSEHQPFRLGSFLVWVSLILILPSNLALGFFLGNIARETLLVRQQDYSLLVGGYLNHQVTRRFVVPTMVAFGRIALRQPLQYRLLDEVVRENVRGLNIKSLRIYGADKLINYSLDKHELGKGDLIPQSVITAKDSGRPGFEKLASMSLLKAMFMPNLPPSSFMLRMSFPLSVRLPNSSLDEPPLIVGVLEIVKDITDDYETVIRLQWFILAMCLGTSAVLFGLLQMFIVHAERILAERMRRTRKLESELHENERLASMGRVISSIAHEIRNPLGIIRSSAELLLNRDDGTDALTHRILEAVHSESKRLSQTVNDFLDYARPRIPKPLPVDMTAIIDQALAFLEGEFIKRNIRLERNTPPALPTSGDKDLLYRALYNVISNAFQAMEKDGTLFIDGEITDDLRIRLSVRDTGPGFPPESLEHALDPFFTTKDHGTGLGLPIVNSIITGHGGELKIANAPEGGALVTITLLLRPDASPAQPTPANNESNDEQRKNTSADY